MQQWVIYRVILKLQWYQPQVQVGYLFLTHCSSLSSINGWMLMSINGVLMSSWLARCELVKESCRLSRNCCSSFICGDEWGFYGEWNIARYAAYKVILIKYNNLEFYLWCCITQHILLLRLGSIKPWSSCIVTLYFW